MIRICTFTGKQKANFYIQSKGLNAGKPLKNPIPNCFAVFTESPLAYQVCFCLFQSKVYDSFITGSVVPFIKLEDAKRVIERAFKKEYCTIKLKSLEKIDSMIAIEVRKIDLYKELKTVLANEILKNGK